MNDTNTVVIKFEIELNGKTYSVEHRAERTGLASVQCVVAVFLDGVKELTPIWQARSEGRLTKDEALTLLKTNDPELYMQRIQARNGPLSRRCVGAEADAKLREYMHPSKVGAA